ncbi:hypothetical protein LY76DRAFT_155868 [Colletotrichum caudatum]|nr:hypothetical protein LY76DRAFT_155868 [Colletotrichum caudatum]
MWCICVRMCVLIGTPAILTLHSESITAGWQALRGVCLLAGPLSSPLTRNNVLSNQVPPFRPGSDHWGDKQRREIDDTTPRKPAAFTPSCLCPSRPLPPLFLSPSLSHTL